MAGYFLDCVGGLIWSSITPPNGIELTRDQYDGLFLYAPADRAAALACSQVGLEYDALHKQADELLAAQDAADMALASACTKRDEVQAVLTGLAGTEFSPETKAELEASIAAANAAHEAALKAYGDAKDAVAAVMPKLDELRAKLSECPPTRD